MTSRRTTAQADGVRELREQLAQLSATIERQEARIEQQQAGIAELKASAKAERATPSRGQVGRGQLHLCHQRRPRHPRLHHLSAAPCRHVED
jgi:hypothetical protein